MSLHGWSGACFGCCIPIKQLQRKGQISQAWNVSSMAQLWVVDGWLWFCVENKLLYSEKALHPCLWGKMYQNERKRAKLNWEKFVGFPILRTAKYIRFLSIHCTIIQCQKNIYTFNFENTRRLKPNVNLHRRIGILQAIGLPKHWPIRRIYKKY